MSVVLRDELSEIESESDYEGSSESSEASFCSANEDFAVYDEATEPIANEQEVAEYAQRVAEEEEEEGVLLSRFAGETDLEDWCKCSNCSLAFVVNREECRCCMEVERCRERMEEVEQDGCITSHPGFPEVCLNRWVLGTAAIGLKTKQKKSYTMLFTQGSKTENEFLRSVAYRQFVRMVWEYVGASKRVPLPCCVYSAIRKEFPILPTQLTPNFHGYEEEDSD